MSLQGVPVDAVGIPWDQWMEQQREHIFVEARRRCAIKTRRPRHNGAARRRSKLRRVYFR